MLDDRNRYSIVVALTAPIDDYCSDGAFMTTLTAELVHVVHELPATLSAEFRLGRLVRKAHRGFTLIEHVVLGRPRDGDRLSCVIERRGSR